jgi:hypothetical protein
LSPPCRSRESGALAGCGQFPEADLVEDLAGFFVAEVVDDGALAVAEDLAHPFPTSLPETPRDAGAIDIDGLTYPGWCLGMRLGMNGSQTGLLGSPHAHSEGSSSRSERPKSAAPHSFLNRVSRVRITPGAPTLTRQNTDL